MVDEAEARALVEAEIAEMGNDSHNPWTPEIKAIERFARGWVVYYGAREGDVLLGGNAPFLVDELTGAVVVTGTAHPIEDYVDNYVRFGDPHAPWR